MATESTLLAYLDAGRRRRPDQVAVEDPGIAEITYRSLDTLTDRLRDRLRALGVSPGDRVGICVRKSVDAVAGIFGAQKCGAAHVPVDATAPAARNAFIFEDCSVRAAIVEASLADALRAALGDRARSVPFLSLDFEAGPMPLEQALAKADAVGPAPTVPTMAGRPEDLAYILYTSGSTGKPKGVMISQRGATCFVDWCSDIFTPLPDDRFSSHAPFHFDLSVLDLYVPLKHGATVVLIGEAAGKNPVTMAALIADRRITCWYSAPSILSLLTQFGRLERVDLSALRLINFAGEVFPVKHLRALTRLVPHPRYFNLYGPTETNVCTFHEVPRSIPDDRTEPYPIGSACNHYRHRVVDADGRDVPRGEEGELWIAGPGVMMGYWNLPERDADVFRTDADGLRWYRTGDIVAEPPDGALVFRGRRDRMVKKRGFRIELGEIEAALYRHPEVKEAAVVARPDEASGVVIRAFLAFHGPRASIIELKQFCAAHLVAYMIPDQFVFLSSLPRTSTDKTDYQALQEIS